MKKKIFKMVAMKVKFTVLQFSRSRFIFEGSEPDGAAENRAAPKLWKIIRHFAHLASLADFELISIQTSLSNTIRHKFCNFKSHGIADSGGRLRKLYFISP